METAKIIIITIKKYIYRIDAQIIHTSRRVPDFNFMFFFLFVFTAIDKSKYNNNRMRGRYILHRAQIVHCYSAYCCCCLNGMGWVASQTRTHNAMAHSRIRFRTTQPDWGWFPNACTDALYGRSVRCVHCCMTQPKYKTNESRKKNRKEAQIHFCFQSEIIGNRTVWAVRISAVNIRAGLQFPTHQNTLWSEWETSEMTIINETTRDISLSPAARTHDALALIEWQWVVCAVCMLWNDAITHNNHIYLGGERERETERINALNRNSFGTWRGRWLLLLLLLPHTARMGPGNEGTYCCPLPYQPI